jgi:protein-S-isoprenylcysteine O-methyltransferase Ste14
MFLRALVAFLACPGMVALLIPSCVVWNRTPAGNPWFPIGLSILLAGLALLLWCVRDFYVAGKGTLAPWAPPRHLVTVGLYRYSRNPMYVAVSLMLAGWALSFWSVTLAIYTSFVIVAFHLRVLFGEEPWLARTHGEAWEKYRARVPRWLL